MSDSGLPSSSRSVGSVRRSRPRSSRSLRSNTSSSSIRLSDLVEECVIPTRMSVLSDNTNIDQPMNMSWWKKLDNTSKEVMDMLNNQPNENVDIENVLDIDIVSSEKTSDSYIAPIDSSDNESIKSIVVPHRNFFASKKSVLPDRTNPFKKFLIATPNDTSPDESLLVVTKKLFNKPNQKKKTSLPTDLLATSLDESTEMVLLDKPKNLFNKRQIPIKKMFPDDQLSESEDERGQLNPKIFKLIKSEERNSRQSIDEWQNLPSSTLMENQLFKHMSLDMAENENIAEGETSNIVLDQVQEYQQINSNNSMLSSNVTQQVLKNNHDKTQDNEYNMQEIQLEDEDKLEEIYVGQQEVEHEQEKINGIDQVVENQHEEMDEIRQEVEKKQEKVDEINLQFEYEQDEMDEIDQDVENQLEKIDGVNLQVEDKPEKTNDSQQEIENEQQTMGSQSESENDQDDTNESDEDIEEDQEDMNDSQSEIENDQDDINSQSESENDQDDMNESDQDIEEDQEDMNDSQSEIENDQDDINESLQEDMNESQAEIENDNDDMNESNPEIDDELEKFNTSQQELDVGITNKSDETLKSPEIILNTATNASATNKNNSFHTNRNTSVRKTKHARVSLFKSSLLPARESTDIDTTQNTTGEGSGWDSHRTTRRTLRQTFGRDFSPRKSLRTLVLEKEAKRKTYDENVEAPGNTTEIPVMFDQDEEIDHEADRLKEAKLDMLFEKIKSEIMEEKREIEEKVMKSLQTDSNSNSYNTFKVPTRPAVKRKATTKPQIKSKKFQPTLVSDMELPEEFVQDMKYKPPKRYKPPNAGWATKRLYNFLEKKLEPKYSYKARVRAEKLVQQLYEWVKTLRRCKVAPSAGVELLTQDFARLGIVTTYFDFYNFIKDYLPMEIKIKVVPDILNEIPSPNGGVFSDIIKK